MEKIKTWILDRIKCLNNEISELEKTESALDSKLNDTNITKSESYRIGLELEIDLLPMLELKKRSLSSFENLLNRYDWSHLHHSNKLEKKGE